MISDFSFSSLSGDFFCLLNKSSNSCVFGMFATSLFSWCYMLYYYLYKTNTFKFSHISFFIIITGEMNS